MVNAVAPEPQKSLESAQLTPAEAKRIKRIEDLVQPWKQKLTDHHIYDVSSTFSRSKYTIFGNGLFEIDSRWTIPR